VIKIPIEEVTEEKLRKARYGETSKLWAKNNLEKVKGYRKSFHYGTKKGNPKYLEKQYIRNRRYIERHPERRRNYEINYYLENKEQFMRNNRSSKKMRVANIVDGYVIQLLIWNKTIPFTRASEIPKPLIRYWRAQLKLNRVRKCKAGSFQGPILS